MAITTVVVTCKAHDQNGDPVVGGVYTAVLSKTEVQGGFIVPEMVSSTADAEGVAVLNLWPNALGVSGSTYRVSGTNPDTNAKFFDAEIYVPNAACNLHEVVVAPSITPLNAAQQALLATQQALEEITTGGYMKMQADASGERTNDVVVKAADNSELLRFTNTNTPEFPVYALVANVLMRTGTQANLLALTSGGGELTSATDIPSIVQLNGSFPGTSIVYSPMASGIWSDATFTLKAKDSVNTVAAKNLTVQGGSGLSGSSSSAGSVIIKGGTSTANKTGGVTLVTPEFAASAANTLSGDINVITGNSTYLAEETPHSTSKNGDIYLTAGSGAATGGSVYINSGSGAENHGNITLFAEGKVILGEGAVEVDIPSGVVSIYSPCAHGTIGFNNTAPIAKPTVTGSRGGNAALASLLTALASYGLITNSTT